MNITEIRKMPTTLEISNTAGMATSKYHESVLRAFHIVEKLRKLLELKVPPEVILELLEIMEEKEDTSK